MSFLPPNYPLLAIMAASLARPLAEATVLQEAVSPAKYSKLFTISITLW